MSSTKKQKKLVSSSALDVLSMMKECGIRECDHLIIKRLSEYTQRYMLLILKEAISSAIMANKKKVDINDLQLAILKAKDSSIPKARTGSSSKPRTGSILKARVETISKASAVSIPKARAGTISKASAASIPKARAGTISKSSAASIPKERARTIPRFSPPNSAEQEVNMIEIPNYDLTNDMLCHIIQTQFNQKMDDVLPKLDDLDIEEVISSLQNNQDKQDNQDVTTYKFNVDDLLNDPYTL